MGKTNSAASNCSPKHFQELSRRGFLSVGVLAGAGLTLPALLRAQKARAEQQHFNNFEGTAKSISATHIDRPSSRGTL